MVSTTPAKVSEGARDWALRSWPELAIAIAVLLVMTISLPSFLNDAGLNDAHLTRWTVERGLPADVDAVRRASISYERAADAFRADPLSWERSASTSILAAQMSGRTGELGVAHAHLVRAVSALPSRGGAWTQMVYADFLQGKFDAQTAAAWRMASLTSRLELDEMKIRLWVGLFMWPQLPDDVKSDLVSLGHTLWSPRVNWPARRAMAEVYARLPQTARSRVHNILPSPEQDLVALATLSKTLSED